MRQLFLFLLLSLLFFIEATHGEEYRSLMNDWKLENGNGSKYILEVIDSTLD